MQNQQSLLDDVSPEVELARQRRVALTDHIAQRTAERNWKLLAAAAGTSEWRPHSGALGQGHINHVDPRLLPR